MKGSVVGLSLISALLIGSALSCRPILRLYESEGYGDEFVEVAREFMTFGDVANVTAHGIQNSRLYSCPEGVWMGFAEENFQGMSSIISSSKLTTDGLYGGCKYENTGNQYKSLKIVGSMSDYTASALVTYPLKGNDGVPTTYLNDTSFIPLEAATFESFILIGNTPVELFTQFNYAGISVCVGPNNFYINDRYQFEQVNHLRNGTSTFTNMQSVSQILGEGLVIHSFRFGC